AARARPSVEVTSRARAVWPARARPAATKPLLVAVTAVTVAGPCGALSTTWVTCTPPSADDTTIGMSPAPPAAKPAATKPPPGPAATARRLAAVAPDGLARACSGQCWPSEGSQTVWRWALAPAPR